MVQTPLSLPLDTMTVLKIGKNNVSANSITEFYCICGGSLYHEETGQAVEHLTCHLCREPRIIPEPTRLRAEVIGLKNVWVKWELKELGLTAKQYFSSEDEYNIDNEKIGT